MTGPRARLALAAAVAASFSTVAPAATHAAAPAAHGSLVAATTARIALPGGTRAAAWHLTYATTTATGAMTEATGALITPASAARRGGPLVALGVGSQGLADACAPSRNLRSGALLEAPLIAALVGRGWSVVVPDGQGLGSPGAAAYGVMDAEGPAMLDAVRAARQVAAAGLRPAGQTALLGYSVGGGTVAAAAELQPAYAPDVALVGAAAGGAVVDAPSYVRRGLRSGATVAALSTLLGYATAYGELDLGPFLRGRGRTASRIVAAQCIFPAIASTAVLGGRGPDAFVRTEPFADPAWAARAASNQLGRTAPAAPVLLFHGAHDQAVPIAPVRTLRDAWRGQGASVTWLPLPAEHISAMVTGQVAAVSWIERRFTSTP